MKRKIFSKLLMVALVIAAVSSFVSCKDYDDDINRLEDQINKAALQSNLEALQQKVDANATTAANAAAAALKAAQDAADAATSADATLKSDLEKAIKTAADAVDAKATENGTKIANALNAIADLQAAVEKGATQDELDAAKTALEAAIAEALQAAKDAAAAADEAQKTALLAEIAKVETIAKDAATKAELTALNTELTGKINALNTKLNDYYTKTQVDALIASKISGLQNADQVLATIQSELAKYGLSKADETVASQISTAVTGLKNDLAAAMGVEEFSQISAKFDSFDTSVSALYSAITSVEILDSYQSWWFGAGAQGYFANLLLYHGKITAADSKFGDNEASWQSAEPVKEFKNGADINFEDGIIVRVNPGNATFTKDQILIVNSLGVALDDYLEIGDPVPFNGLITRASTINSSLWYIPVKMKDGKTIKEIQLAVWDGAELDPVTGDIDPATLTDPILYAVAINNTKGEETADRYVVSSYDVTVDAAEYVPAVTFSFNVNNTSVEEIRNRWEAATPLTVSEQCTTVGNGADNSNAKKELRWRLRAGELSATNPAAVPATAIVGDASKTAAQDATANAIFATKANYGGATNVLNDYRSVKKPLGVQVGKKFTIKALKGYTSAIADTYYAPTENTTVGTVNSGADTRIQWYYVVLDAPRAIESAPSELNAWNSYDITGLNTVVSADKNLDITINSPEALGDIITFRVFAVNYDGTLADPDGRAFSVVVGEASVTNTVTVPYVATLAAVNGTVTTNAKVKDYTNNNSQIIEIPSDVTFSDKYGVGFGDYGKVTVKATSYPTILKADIDIRWALFKDAAGKPATNWSEAKYIKIVVDNPQNMVDNAIVQFNINGNASAAYGGVNVNKLTVKVQKTLPTASTATIEWRNTLEPVNGVLTVYPLASANAEGTLPTAWPNKAARPATWNTANINRPYAVVDLAGYANNLSNTTNEWIVSDVKQNGTAAARTVTGKTPSNLGDGSAYSHFVLALDKTMIHETVDAKINSKYVGVSLESVTATAQDVPFTSWTGKIKFADAIEDFMVLEANKYYYNQKLVTASTTTWGLAATDLRAKAEMAQYYYFYRGGDMNEDGTQDIFANQLYGRQYTGGLTPSASADTDAKKKAEYAALNLKDNAEWATLYNLRRGSDAAWTGTFSYPYTIGELFKPTWGAKVNPTAADLKRQVLCDYLGIIRIADLTLASNTPAGLITDYVLFDTANVQEKKGDSWVASTLITGNVPAANQITLTNIAGQNPTAHVDARIVISGKDVFNQVVQSDKLQMPFTIVANPAQNYMPFTSSSK